MGLSARDRRIRPLDRPRGVSAGGPSAGLGARAARRPCGAAAPLGLLPV